MPLDPQNPADLDKIRPLVEAAAMHIVLPFVQNSAETEHYLAYHLIHNGYAEELGKQLGIEKEKIIQDPDKLEEEEIEEKSKMVYLPYPASWAPMISKIMQDARRPELTCRAIYPWMDQDRWPLLRRTVTQTNRQAELFAPGTRGVTQSEQLDLFPLPSPGESGRGQ